MDAIKLRYDKRAFLPTFIFLLAGIFFLNLFFDLTFLSDISYIVVAGLVSLAIVLVIGVSPFLTDHELYGSMLTLRQGWYFRARIPLGDVKRVDEVESGPVRTGVFFDLVGTAVYVTTQRHDLILLQLRDRRRFGWAWGKRADRVYFDTLDRKKFMDAVSEKGITPSSPAR